MESSAQRMSMSFDDICFAAVDLFLDEHDFPVLRDRLLMNLRGELESVEVLREVWLKYMGGSPEKLIEVYERANDRKESPHYENLIDLFLVSFTAELLAALVAEEYSRNRDEIAEAIKKLYGKSRKRISSAIQGVSKKYERFLRYLFHVCALKDYMEKTKISFADFISIREQIRKIIGLDQQGKNRLPEDYSRFVESFLKEHSLPHFAESFSERLGEELLKLSTRSSKKTCAEKRGSERLLPSSTDSLHFSFYGLEKKLDGLAVNKGYATGKVAVLAEVADCDKVRKGDIVVFVECNPDFVGAVRLAGALIADRGGFTGHAAIVGRELHLPTIVGTGKGTEILKDGMHVFVDAMQGIVYEIRD